ncbi:hypothetical protein TNCV_2187971 [Trichonephila clavipes]|nr:hypothetical protein TNCV_2187971 [Trichonephila clavipes]
MLNLLSLKVLTLTWCERLEIMVLTREFSLSLDHGSKERGPSSIILMLFRKLRIEVVEELFYKYDDAASGQKNAGKPPTVDNTARLSE